MYLTGIAFGLGTIIEVLRFQSIRLREVAAARGHSHLSDVWAVRANAAPPESEELAGDDIEPVDSRHDGVRCESGSIVVQVPAAIRITRPHRGHMATFALVADYCRSMAKQRSGERQVALIRSSHR